MAYKEQRQFLYSCDGCGREGGSETSGVIPENWIALGLNAGLSIRAPLPDSNSTLCPTVKAKNHFCGSDCFNKWIDDTFAQMLTDARQMEPRP